nr:MAG TPA: Transcription initiation factor IIE, alpha FINGER, Transcription [Bacteriophage sp.]
MELEAECSCPKRYYFINVGYEKIAKFYSEKEIRINFSDTTLDFENDTLIFECPECHDNIKIKLNEKGKALYILYTSTIAVAENINVNDILTDIKKENYSNDNQNLRKSLNKLKKLKILSVTNNNSNFNITPNIYIDSINSIINSIEAE